MNYKSALITAILSVMLGKQGIMCPVCLCFVEGGLLEMRIHLEHFDEIEDMEKIFSDSAITDLKEQLKD